MAVSDPLTGLANYRRLISVLEAELDRSRRTQRAFQRRASRYGWSQSHQRSVRALTGSRASCASAKFCGTIRAPSIQPRAMAETNLRWCCRRPAAILPRALSDAFASGCPPKPSRPALSVSAGVAAFPEDGDTPEKLLAAADRNLYRMKNRGTQRAKSHAHCGVSVRMSAVHDAAKTTLYIFSRREAHPHGDPRGARRPSPDARHGIDFYGKCECARRAGGQCAPLGKGRDG